MSETFRENRGGGGMWDAKMDGAEQERTYMDEEPVSMTTS